MSPLAAALLAAVSFALPRGDYATVRHVRALGGATYVAELAEHIEQAALVHGLDPELLAALLVAESGLNPNAVNARTGAWGLGQLADRGARSRVARKDCARHPRTCRWTQVFYAAEALRESFDACGSDAMAIGHYRSGRCVDGFGARRVLRLRDEMRASVKGAT